MDNQSYIQHNSEYVQSGKFEIELQHHKNHSENHLNYMYQDDTPHGRNLDEHKFNIAVDVGSGTGWFANYAVEVRGFEKVYAIEPSVAAVDIAKKIYPQQNKVEWIHGFAEEEISKLDLKEPTFFSFMCILSHMENELAAKILESIDSVAPPQSLISFSEPYGRESHNHLWHIREKQWWENLLQNWKFRFDTKYVFGAGSWKGITAIKNDSNKMSS